MHTALHKSRCTNVQSNVVVGDLEARSERFRAFYAMWQPTGHDLPFPWSEDLSSLLQLLLCFMLRPDRLQPALEAFVEAELSASFVPKPALLDLGHLAARGDAANPILLLLASGFSVLQQLACAAKAAGVQLRVMSLGADGCAEAVALVRSVMAEVRFTVEQQPAQRAQRLVFSVSSPIECGKSWKSGLVDDKRSALGLQCSCLHQRTQQCVCRDAGLCCSIATWCHQSCQRCSAR